MNIKTNPMKDIKPILIIFLFGTFFTYKKIYARVMIIISQSPRVVNKAVNKTGGKEIKKAFLFSLFGVYRYRAYETKEIIRTGVRASPVHAGKKSASDIPCRTARHAEN